MGNDKWLSLKEASKMTGKSVNALRLLVNRKRFDMVKRVEGNGFSQWMIHHDSLVKTCGDDMGSTSDSDKGLSGGSQSAVMNTCQVNTVTLEHYDQQREKWLEERDKLQAGLMMYQYKFEELDRQIRLLPAPVESIPSKLAELEAQTAEDRQALTRSQETIKALEEALQNERSRSWWQKLWGK